MTSKDGVKELVEENGENLKLRLDAYGRDKQRRV